MSSYPPHFDFPDSPPRTERAVSLRPGDAILVGRRLSLWSWLRRPIASAISWRIQRSSGSTWNHVAVYMGQGWISEAEWNKGVAEARLESLLCGEFRVAVVRPSAPFDRVAALSYWRRYLGQYASNRRYSVRTLLLMRCAAVLFGPDAVSRMIRNQPGDGAWICSEWVAAGWIAGGLDVADKLVIPADFARGGAVGLEPLDEIGEATFLDEDG